MNFIKKDITIQYWNGEIYLTLVQNNEQYFLEISNRNKLLVCIEVENYIQGENVINQILPTLNDCEHYRVSYKLLRVFNSKVSNYEAVFLIRVFNQFFSFQELDSIANYYSLKLEIVNGPMTLNATEYDLSFNVFFKGKKKHIGNFVGFFFPECFVFIRNENYSNIL